MSKQPKRFYLSKIVLVAVVSLVAAGLQAWKGWVLDPAAQLAIVSVTMIVLRSVTDGPVRFTVSGKIPEVGPFIPSEPAKPPAASQIPKVPGDNP